MRCGDWGQHLLRQALDFVCLRAACAAWQRSGAAVAPPACMSRSCCARSNRGVPASSAGGHLSHGYQTDTKKISATSIFFEVLQPAVHPMLLCIHFWCASTSVRGRQRLLQPAVHPPLLSIHFCQGGKRLWTGCEAEAWLLPTWRSCCCAPPCRPCRTVWMSPPASSITTCWRRRPRCSGAVLGMCALLLVLRLALAGQQGEGGCKAA